MALPGRVSGSVACAVGGQVHGWMVRDFAMKVKSWIVKEGVWMVCDACSLFVGGRELVSVEELAGKEGLLS